MFQILSLNGDQLHKPGLVCAVQCAYFTAVILIYPRILHTHSAVHISIDLYVVMK
jgi:hypothetical protein